MIASVTLVFLTPPYEREVKLYSTLTLAVEDPPERSKEEEGCVFPSDSGALLQQVSGFSGPSPAFGSR